MLSHPPFAPGLMSRYFACPEVGISAKETVPTLRTASSFILQIMKIGLIPASKA